MRSHHFIELQSWAFREKGDSGLMAATPSADVKRERDCGVRIDLIHSKNAR